MSIYHHIHRRLSISSKSANTFFESVQTDLLAIHQLLVTDQYSTLIDARFNTMTRNGVKILRRRQLNAARLSAYDDGVSERMLRRLIGGSGKPQ